MFNCSKRFFSTSFKTIEQDKWSKNKMSRDGKKWKTKKIKACRNSLESLIYDIFSYKYLDTSMDIMEANPFNVPFRDNKLSNVLCGDLRREKTKTWIISIPFTRYGLWPSKSFIYSFNDKQQSMSDNNFTDKLFWKQRKSSRNEIEKKNFIYECQKHIRFVMFSLAQQVNSSSEKSFNFNYIWSFLLERETMKWDHMSRKRQP